MSEFLTLDQLPPGTAVAFGGLSSVLPLEYRGLVESGPMSTGAVLVRITHVTNPLYDALVGQAVYRYPSELHLEVTA